MVEAAESYSRELSILSRESESESVEVVAE